MIVSPKDCILLTATFFLYIYSHFRKEMCSKGDLPLSSLSVSKALKEQHVTVNSNDPYTAYFVRSSGLHSD